MTEEEMRAAGILRSLGPTAETVARAVSLAQIKGERNSPDLNPVAILLSRMMGGTVYVSATEAILPEGGVVTLPRGAVEYADAFDRGEYA